MATTSPSPSPTHESEAQDIFATFDSDATIHHIDIQDNEPLYTEINIPLPRLPTPPPQTPTSSQASTSLSPPPSTHSRHRSRSLSSFSPFNRSRSASQSSSTTEIPDRLVKPSILKSREVAAAMNLGHQSKRGRSSTVDALAVVPAVLVLSAELFTPGSRGGKLKDGLR